MKVTKMHCFVKNFLHKSMTNVKILSSPKLNLNSFVEHNDGIEISDKDNKLFTNKFLYIWLRDHCRCSICYHGETNQRQTDMLALKGDTINPKSVDIIDDKLKICWGDKHQSEYHLEWLMKNTQCKSMTLADKILWNSAKFSEIGIPKIKCEDLNSSTGMRNHLKNLLQLGVSAVTDVAPTYEATQDVCNLTSVVQETIYGKFWKFSNEKMDHADTAFTNFALPAHTDYSYGLNTAGYQVFHCLEHNGNGGETLLVDGFNAITELKFENCEAFEFLTRFPVPYHFVDKTVHLHTKRPVIEIDNLTGEILQLRFNTCDRATLPSLYNTDTIRQFYQHYIELLKKIRKTENEFWYKLNPGTVLFVDNFRVLHGRSAFTGKRVLAGCYLTRDDLLSKARVLGLL